MKRMSLGTPQFWMVLLAVSGLQACKRDDPKVYEVPSIIEPYIELFEEEAAKRGQTLTIDNLKVEFATDLLGGDAAGLCTFASASSPTPHIRLDTTSFNWQNNLYHREILVLHELGHCILNRQHRDDFLPNGNIASIMRATGEQVYGGSLNAFKRDYYLDELFDPNTPAPDWATNIPAYSAISAAQKSAVFTENFTNNFNNWNVGSSANNTAQITGGYFLFESKSENTAYFTSKAIVLDTTQNFEIETSLKIVSGDNSALFQWAGSGGSNFSFYGCTPDSLLLTGKWTTGLANTQTSNDYLKDAYNKLTIRKIGRYYYLYLNEKFFDVLETEPFEGNLMAFYVGPKTAIHIDYLYVSYLTL
ncbi:MAG: hypothetical protein SF053_07825 [Bacteroidia bacterium]|nr:hypothetical protein [Bacteroidia bacterium]